MAPERARRGVLIDRYIRQSTMRGEHQEFYGFARYLASRCEQLEVIVTATQPEGHQETDGNLRVHALPVTGGMLGQVRFVARTLGLLRRLEREEPLDFLWLRDPLASGLLGWRAARGRRWIVDVRNDFFDLDRTGWHPFKCRLMRALTTFTCRRASGVRVMAEAMRDDLVAVGVAPDRIIVAADPVDLARFDPGARAAEAAALRDEWGWPGATVLLFIGHFLYTKGLDLLLEALAQTGPEAPELRLVLLGGGAERERFEAQAAALGLAGRVRFVDKIPHEAVPTWLAAADGLVLPSRAEGLPRCVLEAGAMARPVIVTDVGGAAEALRDGVTGWLVEPTVESIAAALRAFAATPPAEREAMGQAGRQLVEERFELHRVLDSAWEHLIGDPPPAR